MSYALAPSLNRRQLRVDLLAFNRGLAGLLGMDPRLTISSNLARVIARTFRIPFSTAKLWFHGGVAGFAALCVGIYGMSAVAATGIGALMLIWLEGFDSSRREY